jgi:hypothetical protein
MGSGGGGKSNSWWFGDDSYWDWAFGQGSTIGGYYNKSYDDKYWEEAQEYVDKINKLLKEPTTYFFRFTSRETNPYEYYAGNLGFGEGLSGDFKFSATKAAHGGEVMRLGKLGFNFPDPNEHPNYDALLFRNSDWEGRMAGAPNLAYAGSEYYQELTFPFESSLGGIL